jgi:hypothetical protein
VEESPVVVEGAGEVMVRGVTCLVMDVPRTGEVAKRGGVNLETIRYYARRGLLPRPARTAGGYRVFDGNAVRRIRLILRCRVRWVRPSQQLPDPGCARRAGRRAA